MTAVTIAKEDARRIAIRAQRLDADRPTDLLDLVRELTYLQLDPTAAIAPSAELIAWSRLGSSFQPTALKTAIEVDRTLWEHKAQDEQTSPAIAMVRSTADLGLHLAEMTQGVRYKDAREWLAANERFRRDVLARLRDSDGPLLSREIADTAQVPWVSTGWTHDQNVTRMLEFLVAEGEVATAGRVGRQRTFDLAERVYPRGVVALPLDEARRIRDERRLSALGIARAPMVGEAGERVRVEGSDREWRVAPDAIARLSAEPFVGRTALLSPFDRLIHDRVRSQEVFDFEYLLEMYKPAAKRRWGYFALPILHDDRLVGKLDALADRKAAALVLTAIHEDVPFTKTMTADVNAEIEQLAGWLDLTVTTG
ncbi:DNA glycosylase AlkZ-like family protein [Leifsonia sp. NPDC058292]|uniref:DNA glycosylase AlkZ-like family protein n=1 Tax=Leifsonia sp. NPDC058292 TaxID=3346428 RepID=UPI0036DAB59C